MLSVLMSFMRNFELLQILILIKIFFRYIYIKV